MEEIDENMGPYLSATDVIDSDHPSILEFAAKKAGSKESDTARACALFDAVRDEVEYNPQTHFYRKSHYKASNVLKRKSGYCVSKACLLCALGRAVGIPTRLGLADIRNFGAGSDIVELMGTDIFTYHGFVEFFLNGRWVKATPAFDRCIYEKHNIPLLTFNGSKDAVFPSHDRSGRPYVEYIRYHGTFSDLPLDDLIRGFRDVYGNDRVDLWIEMLEAETAIKSE